MGEQDDLPSEEVEAAKRKSRINALILGMVFLLLTFAPNPWNSYAPLLFIIPLVYSLVRKFRRASGAPVPPARMPIPSQEKNSAGVEPYSYTPRDPGDPRKYKPIG